MIVEAMKRLSVKAIGEREQLTLQPFNALSL
jgi:hypothetical protein